MKMRGASLVLLSSLVPGVVGGVLWVVLVTQVPAFSDSVRGPMGLAGMNGQPGPMGLPGPRGQDADPTQIDEWRLCSSDGEYITVVTSVSLFPS